MKILFMGTPDFASTVLEYIIKSDHEIVGVISQPDKKKGRGQKLVYTHVHQTAENAGLITYQPETLKDMAIMPLLEELKPEVIVVVAYGKILPEYILNYPKYGCINIHASLLPKYRGAAPIQWAIIDGLEETGVTAMYMEKGLDTGDMLLKKSVKIKEDETAEELFERLSHLGGELILETLSGLEKGELKGEKQNGSESSYAPLINKALGEINWSKNVFDIKNLVRGLNSWPLAYTYCNGEIMKIGSVNARKETHSYSVGEVIKASAKEGLFVAANDGIIEILTCQFEGKKMMNAKEYLMGHSIDIKTVLGK